MTSNRTLREWLVVGVLAVVAFACSPLAAAQAAGPYEPNDVENQAVGPLGIDPAHSVIDAYMETDNDVDYFYFWAPKGDTQVRADLANLSPDDGTYESLDLQLYDDDRNNDSTVYDTDPGQTSTLSYTVSGPAKIFLEVSCDWSCGTGDALEHYQLTLTPTNLPASDTTPIPPPVPAPTPPPAAAPIPQGPSKACKRALSRRAHTRKAYRHAVRMFHRHPSHKRLRAVKRTHHRYLSARKTVKHRC